MSVKHALLALLEDGPQGVYRLHSRFEEITAGQWSLNIGQAYSTMQRLERDGYVESVGSEPSTEPGRADIDLFTLTPDGHTMLEQWWAHPVDRGKAERDECSVKIACALDKSAQLAQKVIDQQRFATMAAIQKLNKNKRTTNHVEPGWYISTERTAFLLEAELRWLDHIQQSVVLASLNK